MATIRWSLEARNDLRAIRSYLDRLSPEYSRAIAMRFTSAVGDLGSFPEMGRVVPEIGDETVRELIVQNYRLVYRIRADGIGVVAIVHGSMDLTSRVAPRLWDLT